MNVCSFSHGLTFPSEFHGLPFNVHPFLWHSRLNMNVILDTLYSNKEGFTGFFCVCK